ncbi:MAG TPA: ribosome assembly RNA-binding protein YhbY [Herpetosiphonaceae bacterium]
MHDLTNTQRQYLRRLAHDLKPVVQIGKQGLTEQALASIDRTIEARELIKVKFLDFQDQRQELSEAIAQQLNSTLIGVVGNVAIFYRKQPDPDKRRVELPAAHD